MTERTSEISQQPESLVQPEPVLEIPQVKNRSFFKAVLLMVLGLLIVAGTVYAGTRIGKKQITPSKIIAEPTLKPVSPTPDPTADWKTYTNEKYSISFKYPFSWFVKDVTNEAPGNFLQSIAFFANGTTNPSVGAEGSEGNELLNLIITNPLINTEPISQSKEQFINSWGKIKKEKIVYIDNLPAAYNTNLKSVVIWYNEKIQIFVNPYQDTKNIMDQILSTFKFTNEDNTVEGRFCGGIAANLPENQCPEGYDCKLDGNYPDASGKCLKK